MKLESEEVGFGPWALFWLLFLLLLLSGSVLASQSDGWVAACGISGLIFLSAAMVGALLGFIFAVPRVIAKEGEEPAGDVPKGKLLSTNTNLERISDWLATMLVGVGLSQLTNINDMLLEFRRFLAETATVYVVDGQPPSAGVLPLVGPFILVLGAVSGFLLMYLLTRLVLVGFFRSSEEMLSGVAVAAIRVAVASQAALDHAEMTEASGTAGAAAAGGGRAAGKTDGDADDGTSAPPSLATAATFRHAYNATTLSNDEALEVMFELLYEPGGFRRVIQMSGELSRSPIARRADYWFYLSAAFGQQMHHSEPNTAERQFARERALDAAQRAVRIDRSYRGRLWEISNPNSTDNDLALLRDDPEFRKILGRK